MHKFLQTFTNFGSERFRQKCAALLRRESRQNKYLEQIALALGIAAALAFFNAPAFAQGAQESPITDTHTNGSWSVRCYRTSPFVCDLSQAAVDRQHNMRIASISLSYIPKSNNYIGRFVVPLGVSFDQGMGIEIGSFKAASLKYRVCERDGCYVAGVLPSEMIDAMRAPGISRGMMTGVFIDGRKFQIPIMLDGFSDGLDLLKKWTVEKSATSKK